MLDFQDCLLYKNSLSTEKAKGEDPLKAALKS